jgi:hypothetical protein
MQKAALAHLRLKDLTFGFDSADFEAKHKPDLLLRGFVDHMGLAEEARNGPRFLFLGCKGSGKSALGEHLRLVAKEDPHLFVESVNIDDVSFAKFSQILKGTIEPEARYPRVWSWFLLLFLLDCFSKDEGSNFTQDDDLFLSVEALKQLGLLPEPTLSRAVNTTSEENFPARLGSVFSSIGMTSKTTEGAADFPFFIDRLKSIGKRFKSNSRHLLIIDGFDELIRRGHLQYDALGCLIFEANRLNLDFAEAGNSAKIIVLCRTDLFERLPGPNKNKVRQNSAAQLDWCGDPWQLEKSSLVTLINQRASLTAGKQIDVFETYLPAWLNVYRQKAIRIELLDHTRHLPRDIVNLFIKLQEYSGDGRMTPGQVMAALAAYSRDYFVPEIIDEMDGYIDGEHIEMMKRLLGSVRRIQTSMDELQKEAKLLGYPDSFDLKKILDVLFDCSAIGNIAPSQRGRERSIFKYRNRYASFNQLHKILLHRGLWHGLNLSW